MAKRRMVRCALFILLILIPQLANAQASGTSQLIWDQGAPSLVTAQAYTYKYYPDASATGITLTGVTCTLTATIISCAVAYPAFTPGAHSLQLTATNVAGESVKSVIFNFTFVIIPSSPSNIRIG